MTDRTKMYLRLAVFLFIAASIAVGLYYLFFVQPPSVLPPDDSTPNTTIGGLPVAGEGQPQGAAGDGAGLPSNTGGLTPSPIANGGLTAATILTTAAIRAPQAGANGVTYYDPHDGRFYRLNARGEAEAIDGLLYPNAQNVQIAPNSAEAIVEFPDGANIVVNLDTKAQYTLPAHWEDFSFTPDSQSLVAKSMPNDVNSRALIVTSADGSTTSVIAALGENASKVYPSAAPNNDILAFSATGTGGSSFGQNTVYLVAANGQAVSSVVVNGSAFESHWAPNGNNFLYSVADAGDEYRPSLWYSDKRGDRAGAIRLRIPLKTTADKCIFGSDTTLYCAVPAEAPAGSGADTSLFRGGDSLYKVSLPSGTPSPLAQLSAATAIDNLSLSPDGTNLYFTDQLNRLNMIRLQ